MSDFVTVLSMVNFKAVIFISFPPFFAMKELSRVMGNGKLYGYFIKEREQDDRQTSVMKDT